MQMQATQSLESAQASKSELIDKEIKNAFRRNRYASLPIVSPIVCEA
jgi:hypothetical protein